jgi:hypothetical protein
VTHRIVLEALRCDLNLITGEEELREIISGIRPGSVGKLHRAFKCGEDHICKFREGICFHFRLVSLAGKQYLSLK